MSQEDIRRNISKEGGGTVDNNRERTGPLWPTVIEAGFAELNGRDAQGRVNLDRGYETIGSVTRGGCLSDGIYALTGDSDRNLQIRNPDAPPMVPTGPDHVMPPGAAAVPSGVSRRQGGSGGSLYRSRAAPATGRPVSMATQGRDVRDGLMESHAHMVAGVSRDPQTNDALITLRNPYGTNRAVGEGNQNIGAGWNASNPEITVSLNRLVCDGSFGEFNIGAARAEPATGHFRASNARPTRLRNASAASANQYTERACQRWCLSSSTRAWSLELGRPTRSESHRSSPLQIASTNRSKPVRPELMPRRGAYSI